MSGQLEKQLIQLSTPTIEGIGINAAFNASTQDHYHFRCPSCSKLTLLTFPECLVITGESHIDPEVRNSYLICKECKNTLPHAGKIDWLKDGQWISTYSGRSVRGFHVSQLYSMTVRPWELALSYLKGCTNATDEQEFFNSKLGLPHEVEGARVNDVHIAECIGGHTSKLDAPPNSFITMGVDPGKKLHYTIEQWFFDRTYNSIDINLMATPRVLAEGSIEHFEDLDRLMVDYRINFAVLDRNPETRKALEFANRWYGRVKLCLYVTGLATSKQIRPHSEETHAISVDRTSWMDLALGRFHRKKIILPKDTSQEYKEHIKTPVRVTKKDKAGNIVAKYVDPDHLAHARVYSEIALALGANLAKSHNMDSVL
jgi:hypothetical protein